MKKCSCCLSSGIFMRLKNGLCPQCQEDFKKCENEYKSLFARTINVTSKESRTELISSIKMLSIELRKFDRFSTTLKSSDCDQLIESLNEKYGTPRSIVKVKENLEGETMKLNIRKMEPPVKKTTDKEKNIPIENDSSEEIISETTPLKNDNDKADEIDNQHIGEENTDAVQEGICSEREINTDDSKSEKTDHDDTIAECMSPALYDEAKNILHMAMQDDITSDDLCYYTFLLKDNYLPMMKKCGMSEIDGINIEDIIAGNLKKASIILNLDTESLHSHFNYVAFSIQTTGISIPSNHILEIAAYKVQFGHISDSFHTLINPFKTISLSQEKKTGITNEELSKAPSIDTALSAFKNFVGDYTLVSHNSNYNYGFIKYNYERVFGTPFNYSTKCTMKLYRKRFSKFHGEPPRDSSLISCCRDLLTNEQLSLINGKDSKALAAAEETLMLYEIIKNRYK